MNLFRTVEPFGFNERPRYFAGKTDALAHARQRAKQVPREDPFGDRLVIAVEQVFHKEVPTKALVLLILNGEDDWVTGTDTVTYIKCRKAVEKKKRPAPAATPDNNNDEERVMVETKRGLRSKAVSEVTEEDRLW